MIFTRYEPVDQIEKNKIGGAFGTYMDEMRKDFGGQK